ncbi:hypothetical protein K1719_045040 [Acacia pycnantha]|nr:hypothetical protein K1719_045040 [Acacia pycnantha]
MAQENGREARFSLREAIPWMFNHFNLNSETTTQFGRKIMKSRIHRTIQHRISVVRPCVLRLLHHFPTCYGRNRYRMLSLPSLAEPPSSPPYAAGDIGELGEAAPTSLFHAPDSESDLVALKISLLGDCQIGKTSFLVKYVGMKMKRN